MSSSSDNKAHEPMLATRLKGQVSPDRKLLVEVPEEVAPGAVEVILLYNAPAKRAARRVPRAKKHPAFGLWADRADLTDSAEYAADLRHKLEGRQDGHG